MTKKEKIDEYIRKTAEKHGVSFEEAKGFKMTQNVIAYMEKEVKDDTGIVHSTDLLDIDDKSC